MQVTHQACDRLNRQARHPPQLLCVDLLHRFGRLAAGSLTATNAFGVFGAVAEVPSQGADSLIGRAEDGDPTGTDCAGHRFIPLARVDHGDYRFGRLLKQCGQTLGK